MKLRLTALMVAVVAVSLHGCGGGGGGTPALTETPAKLPVTIGGTAASGAAFQGATIYAFDGRGIQVGSTSAINPTTGAYSLTLQDGAVVPMVVVATRTSADGQTETLVSLIGSATQTTANITPITSLIASLLSPSGNPANLLAELKAGTAVITPASITSAVSEISRILAPLLTATGTTSSDPMTATFTTDGTGYDRLLDSITVSITPASSTASNIDIGVRTNLTEGTQPIATSFSTASVSTATVLPAVDLTTLVVPGTSALITSFMAQLSSCYALPLSSRITTGGTTAADIIAPECRTAFFSNDPATFLSNGAIVAKGKAFTSLYSSGATGVVFSQGTYEFTRTNGDIVAGYKSRDVSGNETFDTLTLRKDTDGKLKLIGNQYAYQGAVTAYHQLRQFLAPGQAPYNYYSSGYTLNVNDVLDANGDSIFSKVVVTQPNGVTLTLQPGPGLSFLSLMKADITTGTSFLRLAREYTNTSNTSDPEPIDPTLFFSPTRYTDSEIQALPAQSVWKYEYFLKGNPTVVTQYFRTRARAMTIGELRTRDLAALTSEIIQSIDATNGSVAMTDNETVNLIGAAGSDAWTVAQDQLPPTRLTAFGRFIPASPASPYYFDDTQVVGSTARKGSIPCSAASSADLHCYKNPDNSFGPGYALGSRITGVHLQARDVAGREFANFYAFYKLTLPTP